MNRKRWLLVFWGMMIMFNIFALNLFADGVKPGMIPHSNRYNVEIRQKGQQKWKALFVYQGINPNQKAQDVSWASFELSNAMEVRINPLNVKTDSIKVRPGAFGVKCSIIDNYAILQIDRPLQISVEINGNKANPLLLFANPSEVKPFPKEFPKTVFFKPGIHQIGECYPLKSNTTYYLEEGSYLKGSMYGKGTVENVTIKGRGIIDSGYQLWQHPTNGLLSNIIFEDGRNIDIEGITCIGAGNFQLKIQSKGDSTSIRINNVKLIGWNNNTDGIHVSDMDWKDHPIVGNAKGISLKVENCFIRANDDAILLCDGVARSEMKNCVIWDDGGGASFCLSWGGHNKVDSCLVSHCYVIHKEGKNPVFRANHAGEAVLQNIRFEDITIEGDAYTLFGLRIFNHRYDPDPGMGSIRNITFKNIFLEGTTTQNFIEGFDAQHQISNITFDNIRINGRLVRNQEDMNLKMNSFVKDIQFGK
ncbi:MAG: glycosyl hydrolase family 28 protein [Mariniphaga sp.]